MHSFIGHIQRPERRLLEADSFGGRPCSDRCRTSPGHVLERRRVHDVLVVGKSWIDFSTILQLVQVVLPLALSVLSLKLLRLSICGAPVGAEPQAVTTFNIHLLLLLKSVSQSLFIHSIPKSFAFLLVSVQRLAVPSLVLRVLLFQSSLEL